MKKLNNFILHPYPSKTILLVLIAIIIFFVIPIKIALASPLINVPLDSWVYQAISRLNTLQALEGNDHIAPNTTPLTRLEIALLIDTSIIQFTKRKNKT